MRFLSRVLSFRSARWWILLALLLAPFIGRLERYTADTGALSESESAKLALYIRQNFVAPSSENALLVISGLAVRVDTDSGRAELRRLLEPIVKHEAVTLVASPASLLDTLLIGTDGHSAIALVGLRSGGFAAISALRSVTARSVASSRERLPTLRMEWTGQSAVLADVRTAGAVAFRRAELIALPVTMLVALVAFGSWSLLLLALLAAVLVLAITLGLNGLLGPVLQPTLFTRPLASMLGLALSVDYVLLLARWPRHADGSRTPEQTVRIAGFVVAVGLLGLSVAPVGELRSAALSGAFVALLASLVASTIVVRGDVRAPVPSDSLQQPLPNDRWVRWGSFVVRHPWKVLIASAIPLFMLVWAASTARFETPLTGWLPAQSESVRSLETLRGMQRGALPGTVRLVVHLPAGTPILSEAGWAAITRLDSAIRKLPGAGDIRALHTIGTRELLVAQHVFPQALKDLYIARNGHEAIVDVIPQMDASLQTVGVLVSLLRSMNAPEISGVAGASVRAGGLTAYVFDYERILQKSLPWIVAATATASLLAILLLLRAPIVAFKAVLLNLLVAASALGATVLVFQHGFGVGLLGHEKLGSIFPTVPVLAFTASFGVSTDYELFLLSGVRAARERGATHLDSVVLGLASVGSTITRAALAMVGIFLAFAFSDMMPLAMVGFSLAVAVLLDATLVRLALAPATLALAGRWNWWPGPLSK